MDLKKVFSEFRDARDEQAAPPASMSQAEINCFDAMFRDAIIDAALPANRDCGPAMLALRDRLMAEMQALRRVANRGLGQTLYRLFTTIEQRLVRKR